MLFLLESVLGAEESPISARIDGALLKGGAVLRCQRLHQLYAGPIMRYVSRRLRPLDAAEDVVALTFEHAYRSIAKLRAAEDPYIWLLGIARRKVADAYRERERRKELPIPPEHAMSDRDPQSQALETEKLDQVRQAVFELASDQREALLLQYLEKLSQREIGLLLDRSPEAVNGLVQRARQNLRKSLAPYFPELENDHV